MTCGVAFPSDPCPQNHPHGSCGAIFQLFCYKNNLKFGGKGWIRGGGVWWGVAVQERLGLHIRIIVITHQVSHSCIHLTSSWYPAPPSYWTHNIYASEFNALSWDWKTSIKHSILIYREGLDLQDQVNCASIWFWTVDMDFVHWTIGHGLAWRCALHCAVT